MLWLFLSLSAQAETFTLDNGATVVGLLADYNMRGSCQISVSDGPYSGAILTVPCERIVRFERNAAAAALPEPEPAVAAPVIEEAPPEVVVVAPLPAPEPLVEEVVVSEPEPEPVPLAQPVDAPFATADTHAPTPEAEVAVREPAPEPVVEETAGLWAEEPASTPSVQPSAAEESRPTIGGVVLPQLPNLRMMRRPAEEQVDSGEEL